MRVNFKEVYQDRIKQIRIDINKAVKNKKWTRVAELKAEQAELEEKISKMK